MFALLPFIGFFLGVKYKEGVDVCVFNPSTSDNKNSLPRKVEATASTPQFTRTNPTRGYCPSGYLEYQNSAYSICYPTGWEAGENRNVVDPESGSMQQNVTSIRNNLGEISVIPSFSMAGGKDSCTTTTSVSVGGYEAIRTVSKEKLAIGCGSDRSFHTWINSPSYPHFFLGFQPIGDTPNLSQGTYVTMEQSIKFK